MSRKPPGPGMVLAGLFRVVCGLSVIFLGGNCTIAAIGHVIQPTIDGTVAMAFFLGVSVLTLVTGLAILWVGVQQLRGDDIDD